MKYSEFLSTKLRPALFSGVDVQDQDIHSLLFPFQRDLTRWALRKGRSAIFADTGLGKTLMQLEWARLCQQQTLIIAPLSVARQTVAEGVKIDVPVQYVRDQAEVNGSISITNYEMLSHFDPERFGAIVLDESSILKALAGKTRKRLTEMFSSTPYRLCCTATPAPNDIAEIANHAEFLGIMTRAEMLSMFFVHDDDGWRLKGHAREAFYKWLASWGMSVKLPSDLGYEDDGFILPELRIEPTFIRSIYVPEGQLFFTQLHGISDRSKVRKATLQARVGYAADLVNSNGSQWIVWCGLNAEQDAMTKAIPDAVSVQGKDSVERKMERIQAFQDGDARVLITKPKIAGFGMNFQNCHKMAFVGLSDSWESYYQCVRRCWRFGQKEAVEAHVILADVEDAIWSNVQHKDQEAANMQMELIKNVQQYEKSELGHGQEETFTYETETRTGEGWTMMLGDSSERMAEVEDESVDLSIFSPPFASLYTYSPTERDIGNSISTEQFFRHFGYIIRHLLRVTRPGRNCCVHCADVATTLQHQGVIGLSDFPGDTIRACQQNGWVYHGRVTIDKNPQAQAIRTHSKALLFAQKNKDSSWLRPAIGDYILIFRKPGENVVPVKSDISNEDWIKWAHPVWYGITESDTLNYRVARENEDERHICPLQLGTIERCLRLWSNPGELVLSPFAGIGSEGYQAIRFGRRFVGIELKRSYYDWAVTNLIEAVSAKNQMTLFDMATVEAK